MSNNIVLDQFTLIKELHTEIIRKSIHMMIVFVPIMAKYNLMLTFSILVSGLFLYSYSEFMRMRGIGIALISRITSVASRSRDKGFIFGPITLGFGTIIALLLYPAPAATVAIYALAFGDGFASLFGKLFGRITIPFTGGKTYAGSSVCLISVFLTTLAISGSVEVAVIIAILATLLEVLPSGDFDNMLIPIGTGLVSTLIM